MPRAITPQPRSSGAVVRPIGARTSPAAEAQALQADLALAFAPLHKAAFGLAIGTAFGAVVFAMTAISVLRGYESQSSFSLWLLAQYFYGYTVSWAGAFVGFAWGMVAGFVAGWFFAFCRNFALAASMFIIRTRAELAATRDFLDHV